MGFSTCLASLAFIPHTTKDREMKRDERGGGGKDRVLIWYLFQGLKIKFFKVEREGCFGFFFFLAVIALFPETLHRKCLMCEVMSVT